MTPSQRTRALSRYLVTSSSELGICPTTAPLPFAGLVDAAKSWPARRRGKNMIATELPLVVILRDSNQRL